MFSDEREADNRVPARGGGRRLCSRARGDGDYVYVREGLCARASTRGKPAFVFPDEGEADDYVSGQGGRPRFMFPDKGEANDRVSARGRGRRLCSRGRGDGDYVYGREGLCARASTRGRPAFIFPGEGEADNCVSGRGGGQGLCFQTRGRPTIVFPAKEPVWPLQ